jgi:hypothetical protein
MSAFNGHLSAGWNSPLFHYLGEEPVPMVSPRIEALDQRDTPVRLEIDNADSGCSEINVLGLMWQLR